MREIEFVVAVAKHGVIGRDGGLPWHIPSELKRFKQLTMGKPIIMGRKTWESLPKRPLSGRLNIVVTRQPSYKAEGAVVVSDKPSALAAAGEVDHISVIGGGELYSLFWPDVDRIYMTEVDIEIGGDTYFPALPEAEWSKALLEDVAAEPAGGAPAYKVYRLERIHSR